jgi:bifunctional UDP-N-acetylglucosamine pyrophosphorylase/glucosamine-1-phosphate N-acetyltransferase
MDQQLAIIVLAAGQGTRMKSATPKLLHPLAGSPIVAHVLRTAQALDAAHVIAVVRHERDQVAAAVEATLPGTVVVDQDEIPGTGRAVEQAVAALPDDFAGEVLVLNGDVPLLDADTLAAFLERHRGRAAQASVLSAFYDDPTGYGRVVRDDHGAFDRIVEQKDASDDERAIDEINAGVYAFGAGALRDQLANLTTDNAQGEKYLTDVIQLLRAAGSEVEAVPVSQPWLVAGINDRAQLSETAARLNALIVRGWQLAGVTIEDPATTWIDLDVKLEHDVTIRPGTQLKGATVVATGSVIGPDTTLVDCEVGRGAEVKPRCRSSATGHPSAPSRSCGPARCSAPTARSARSWRRRTRPSARAARYRISPTSATPRSACTRTSARARSSPTTTACGSTIRRWARTCAPARTASSSRPLGLPMGPTRAPARSSARTSRPGRWP